LSRPHPAVECHCALARLGRRKSPKDLAAVFEWRPIPGGAPNPAGPFFAHGRCMDLVAALCRTVRPMVSRLVGK
jgi:hypothetical protein